MSPGNRPYGPHRGRHPGWGFWKLHHRSRKEGLVNHHKHTLRISCSTTTPARYWVWKWTFPGPPVGSMRMIAIPGRNAGRLSQAVRPASRYGWLPASAAARAAGERPAEVADRGGVVSLVYKPGLSPSFCSASGYRSRGQSAGDVAVAPVFGKQGYYPVSETCRQALHQTPLTTGRSSA